MKTVKEQIEDKCIHFNGMMNHKCNAGVIYQEVADKSSSPFKFPCIENSPFTGSHCDKRETITEEELYKKIKEIEDTLNKHFDS